MRRSGIWLTVLSALAFSWSGPFAKALMDSGWSPGGVVFARLAGAALVAFAVAAAVDARALRVAPRQVRSSALYGIVAIATVQATFFLAIQSLSVGVTLMIQFLAPIVVIGWEWLVRDIRPSTLTILGAVLALAGAVLVIDVFGATEVSIEGIAWAALSMLGNACFFLMSTRSAGSPSPVVTMAYGMVFAALAVGALGVTGLFTMTFATDPAVLASHDLPWILPLVLLITISTVVAYLCGIAGVGLIGATLTSLVLLTEVLFGVISSWLLLGQTISVIQLLGGSCIVGGVAIARLGGAGAAEPFIETVEPTDEAHTPSPRSTPPSPIRAT
ncbi:EamA family transporter [Antrihabitans stalactiti]|uniref:EamA family transporter n=1 Tax=Antrihabitans stalactiti TaxID=2584121 RepID=A0A848KK88_9NOCA|nr:EamA family transporter [Antrihabitans stalactiti]